jgi:dipeptidyl aminopeptidase/acylaminoacyl peptidase
MKKLEDYGIMPIFPQEPVSDPQISPDGARVLFTYTTVNMEKDRYSSHVWLLYLKSRMMRQFTHGNCNDSSPKWSPDGRNILFLSNRFSKEEKPEEDKERKNQIWIIPANGGEAWCLTSIEEGVQRPAWSPDGKTILFFSDAFKGEKNNDSDVRIIRRIKYKHNERGFFEGKWIHLFSVPSTGGKVKQLTDGEFDVDTAVWSPDGRNIAFVSNLEEYADLHIFKNIYNLPSTGGKPELLWKGRGPIEALGWSPDGKYLSFVGREIENPNLIWHKNTELFVLPVKGGEPKNLTVNLDRTVQSPEVLQSPKVLKWSPDSKYIYFLINDKGATLLCRVSLDGEVKRVIEGKMTVLDFSLDDYGSLIAFTSTDATTPSELWVKDKESMKRVTDINKELLNKLKISDPKEFWFTASDGVLIQGWIIKPYDFKEGEKYPMILEIHGGPRIPYGYLLKAAEHEFQVLAEHGFVVVFTNPRGSLGYGEAFAAHTAGHWLERDYEDLMEAVAYVIDTCPFVDPDRLGVCGGSYGGLMANWIVGHTDRFKAAVACRCVSNFLNYTGTSDVAFRPTLTDEYSWGEAPWDNPEQHLKVSPIMYIKNIKTPLLLIHSEEDYRDPIDQAEQIFAGLKKLKKEVEFVRFPGESHELSRSGKPKHRVERLQHIVRWFDSHLKGN